MLHQASHWMEIAGAVADALLLCRILALRLYRVYLFITLACILALLFDGVGLWLGDESQARIRVFVYSRFLYAFVYPMVAWDVFEEIKTLVGKLRKLALARLISGLVFTAIFGLIMAVFFDTGDTNGEPVVLNTMALVLWAGASLASFAFLLTIYRVLRKQPLARPNNTNVWMYYYGLSFLAEVLVCFFSLVVQAMNSEATRDALFIAFATFGIVLTGWCIWKLRAIPSELPTASENAPL